MVDIDLAQSTFEYIVRKKMDEGKLPVDKSFIACNDRIYLVNWNRVKPQHLWSKLIDEKFILTLEEEDLESIFEEAIQTFIDNLSVIELNRFNSDLILSDLSDWKIIKHIPKHYFKG